MSIDVDLATRAVLPDTSFSWDERDVILYHLALGAGANQEDLQYTWEQRLKVLPTFAVLAPLESVEPVLYSQVDGLAFNVGNVLHGEQELVLNQPLPTRGRCENNARIVGIHDKGKAALLDVEVESRLAGSDEPLFTNRFRLFVRGEGGFGSAPEKPRRRSAPPEREPDAIVRTATAGNQALLYRLCGDRNPLHVDREVAIQAGFERPILHGLCTFGIACKAAVDSALGGDVSGVRSVSSRFAGVVYPGETLLTDVWRENGCVILQTRTEERNSPVLANACVEVAT